MDAAAVRTVLAVDQMAWLSKVAAEQTPPLSASTMLRRLVDEAMAESRASAGRRAEQLEIYRASGYPEHHPDYPDFPWRPR